ncbi:PstS family phosphate ABC transporter substrate-binding protein [Halalkalibaculum sp. DA3122]|uniref:PstS family phosphate ABC transporter substrate-binding protein n=1 Tax=unclassified Halalkalibaculum TaxID=2964617 RepID=UPI0037546843
MNKSLFLTLLVASFLLSSCGSGGDGDTLSGRINIDGSSTVFPVTEAVAEEFRSEAPDVRVTVGVSGTGGGFQKFVRGETAINNASREISPTEIEAAKQNGVEYLQLSVAYDGLAVVVHPENDWVDYLTVEELKTIWEPEAQDEITQWNHIRPDWPENGLNLYGPGVASGTYDYFTEAVVGESGASRGDFTASEDDNVLVQGVSTDQYALGFFGLAYYEENQEQLRLVPVKHGEKDPVAPSIETVSNDTYTPLSRPLFIYVSKEAAQRPAVQQFIEFYLDIAPELTKSVGYVAMPDSVYQVQKDKFHSFISSDSTSAQP